MSDEAFPVLLTRKVSVAWLNFLHVMLFLCLLGGVVLFMITFVVIGYDGWDDYEVIPLLLAAVLLSISIVGLLKINQLKQKKRFREFSSLMKLYS